MKKTDNEAPGLIYVHDSEPGYRRRRHGRGFIYLDAEGRKLHDKPLVERLKALKIPPAWDKVWICRHPNGYLQATGYDNRQRKQYIYHPRWETFSQHEKFRHLYDFGKFIPAIRQRVEKYLKLKGWPREKVLALAVKLMDEKYTRIGNKYYEKENETFGLTTLRRKHMSEDDGDIVLEYKAKSGKYRRIRIEDPRLVRLIKASSELPGYELFRYIDEEGKSRNIDSRDVNEFLQQITGKGFTSKSFRTWSGTVLAVQQYEDAKETLAGDKRKRLKTTIVKKVAEKLGNTTGIAEKYYIHPHILELISTPDFELKKPDRRHFNPMERRFLDADEMIVLHLLEEATPPPGH